MNLWRLDLGVDLEPLVIGQSKPRPNKNCRMMTWSENLSTGRFWLNRTQTSESPWKFTKCMWSQISKSHNLCVFFFVSSRSVIAKTLTNQLKRSAPKMAWTPCRSWIITFSSGFLGTSMVVDESQFEVVAALPRTKYDLLFPTRAVTMPEPSIAIFEGQYEVVVALLKTKYGGLSVANSRSW